MTTLREEIRHVATESAHLLSFNGEELSEIADIIESAILEGVKLVLEREPSDAIGEAIYAAWDSFGEEGTMGPVEALAIYRAMTQELIKELE